MTLRRPSDDADAIAKYHELGVKAAAYIKAHPSCWPAEVAQHLGISGRTYRHWLATEEPAYEAFQALVEPALTEQAKIAYEDAEADIDAAGPAAGAKVSWHKWGLEKRLPRYFGANAGPMVTVNTQVNVNAGTDREQALADLKAEAEVNPELRDVLKGLL